MNLLKAILKSRPQHILLNLSSLAAFISLGKSESSLLPKPNYPRQLRPHAKTDVFYLVVSLGSFKIASMWFGPQATLPTF
jgi:hypothetical protein